MSILDHDNENRPMHLQSLPEAAGKVHAERMMEKEKERQEEVEKMISDSGSSAAQQRAANEEFSLNDDRRVKTLSPSALVWTGRMDRA